MPLFSIVIPAFNAEKYLARSLDSVLTQSVQDFEILVVDDGSSDGTWEILRTFAQRDSRIKIFQTPNSGGCGTPRNIAMRHCVGDYVAFLDSDDWFLPGKLARAKDCIECHPNSRFFFHDCQFVAQDESLIAASWIEHRHLVGLPKMCALGTSVPQVLSGHELIKMSCVVALPILPVAVWMSRESLQQQGWFFDQTLGYGEDLDLWFRILRDHDAVYLPESLAVYRQGGMTSKHTKFMQGFVKLHMATLARYGHLLDRSSLARYRKRIIDACDDCAAGYRSEGRYGAALRQYIRGLSLSFNAGDLHGMKRALCGGIKSTLRRPNEA